MKDLEIGNLGIEAELDSDGHVYIDLGGVYGQRLDIDDAKQIIAHLQKVFGLKCEAEVSYE